MSSSKIENAHPVIRHQMRNYRKLDDAWDAQSVKDRGMDYLPNAQSITTGVSAQVFQTYIDRAVFPEVPARVLSSFLGMAFRKDPVYSVITLDKKTSATGGKPFIEDVDLLGNSIIEFSKQLLGDVIRYGWAVLYCDYDSAMRRPFIRKYVADDAFNWAEGRAAPLHVRLRENSTSIDPMTFEEAETKQIRVLDLLDEGAVFRLFENRRTREGTEWVQIEGPTPILQREQPMDSLPVIPVSTFDTGIWLPETSIMMPLVNMVFSAYQTSADLEIARHQCRIIQPMLFNVSKKETEGLVIGDGSWWRFDQDGKAIMLEANGNVCSILAEAFKEKLEQAAAHGARFLRERKRDAETAEAKRIEEGAEVSIIQAIIHNVSESVRQALVRCEQWNAPVADTGKIEFWINDQLSEDEGFSAETFNSLADGWLKGIAPHSVPAQYLIDHGYAGDMTPEEMLAMVKMEKPELFMDFYRAGQDQNQTQTIGGNIEDDLTNEPE